MTAPTSPTTSTPSAVPFELPSPKQQFLDQFERERATTLKVLRAYPPEQSELRPHPRSNSARELAFTFAIEGGIGAAALRNQLDFSKGFPTAPDSWSDVLAAVEQSFAQFASVVEATPDHELLQTTKFFVAPKTMGDIPKIQLLWFMLCDQIHHRGQLSVYLRLAGAKVPSIYGPSADEPWM